MTTHEGRQDVDLQHFMLSGPKLTWQLPLKLHPSPRVTISGLVLPHPPNLPRMHPSPNPISIPSDQALVILGLDL